MVKNNSGKNTTLSCFLQPIELSMEKFLTEEARKEFDLAIVSGSDISKIKEQLGNENIFEKYDYIFAENGLVAFKNSKRLPTDVRSLILQ